MTYAKDAAPGAASFSRFGTGTSATAARATRPPATCDAPPHRDWNSKDSDARSLLCKGRLSGTKPRGGPAQEGAPRAPQKEPATTRTVLSAAVLLVASTALAAGPVVDSKGHVRWDLTQRDASARTESTPSVERAAPAPKAPAVAEASPVVKPFVDSKGHVR